MNEDAPRIDWTAAKNRLQASEQALATTLDTDDNLETVYKRRAEELAARRVAADASTQTRPALIFRLGNDRYALELAEVRELVPYAHVTPVPGGPAALLGVMNVQGEIRSVVDLATLLGLEGERSETGYVVLLRGPRGDAGLKVGQMEGIQRLAPDQLVVPDEAESGGSLHYVAGVTRDRIRLLRAEAIHAHALFSDNARLE